MFTAPDLFTTLHIVLLLGFVGVTSLLLLVTIVNWLRVRQPVLSWRTGPVLRLPGWPVAFLLTVLVLFGLSVALDHQIPLPLFGGYLLGGGFWLVAASLASSVVVTEYGIITDVNHADDAVGWSQVVDYFEVPQGCRTGFVFFYLDAHDRRRRLELAVPRNRRAAFRALLHRKLDVRFDLALERAYGKKELEG
ncbi:MAG: hypothetical protein D6685_12810 [Bacteroidetes bacterium]|nr:MAG: hypothetical protein D6685_12810 [Bacteroidota bacterium]